jgi:hypothetical protein
MRSVIADIYLPRTREGHRRFELLLFLFWALATAEFSALVVGAKLFLICLYGWTKVHEQGLRILAMPKGHSWPVSNGDFIPQGQQFYHYLISVVCWLAIFFVTYLPLRRILPKNEPKTA